MDDKKEGFSDLFDWERNAKYIIPDPGMPSEIEQMNRDAKNVRRFIDSSISNRRNSFAVPTTLYHYTNNHGLKGILFDSQMWFSDYRSTNDSKEGHIARDVLDHVISDIFPDSLVVGYLKRDQHPILGNPQLIGRALNQRFIACFTTEQDQLSQWYQYGDGGAGFCIGIDSNDLRTKGVKLSLEESKVRVVQPELFPVIYEQTEHEKEIGLYVSKIKDFYSAQEKIFKNNKNAMRMLLSKVYDLFNYIDYKLSLDYKDQGFSQEHEWRCYFNFRPTFITPSVRVSNEGLISYITYPAKAVSVKAGPKADFDRFLNACAYLCLNRGMAADSLTQSKIPFR